MTDFCHMSGAQEYIYRGHSHTASFSEQHKDDDDEGRIWH